MKRFNFVAVVIGALASAGATLPSYAQTATLVYGTDTPHVCTYGGNVGVATNGNITITCTSPVSGGSSGTVGTGPFQLTVNYTSTSGSISASPAFSSGCGSAQCIGSYAANTAVTLTATPASGYIFGSWSGAICSGGVQTGATCTVTMAQATTMTAAFTASTTGGGTTTPSGVTIVPFPAAGLTASASMFNGTVGVTYAMQIPAGGGLVMLSPEGGPPLIGTDGQWEVSISKVAGDWATAKTMAVPSSFGRTVYPFYAQQGGQSGGMSWIASATPGTGSYLGSAYVPPGEVWYFNLRFTNKSGAIYFQYAKQ